MNAATSEPRKFSPSPRPTTSGELRRAATTRVGSCGVDGDQGERALEPAADPLHRGGQVGAATRARSSSRWAATSVSVSETSSWPSRLELGAQLGEVLDDAVVHQRDPAGRPEVRVGVDVVRGAVGGPAGVPDAGGRRRQRRARRCAFSRLASLPARLSETIAAVGHERDPGGVVAAVLQPAQALDHDVLGLLVADVPDDSAHGPRVYRRRGPRPTGARRLQQSPRMPTGGEPRRAPTATAASRRRTSSSTAPPGPRWPARSRTRSPRTRSTALRGLGDALDLDEVREVYLPLSPAAQPVRRVGRPAAPRAGGVPPPAAAAAHAVRDRARRLGRGRQVDHRARAPADAGALARAPATSRWSPPTASSTPTPSSSAAGSCTARASRSPTTAGRCCGSWSTSSPARTRSRRRSTPTSPTTWSPTRRCVIKHPDIVIIEGLNVLQPARVARRRPHRPRGERLLRLLASTSTPATADIREWYVDRFLRLRETAFRDPQSYFARYAALSQDEAVAEAERIWDTINGPNLDARTSLPTRSRATLVLRKDARPLGALRAAAQALASSFCSGIAVTRTNTAPSSVSSAPTAPPCAAASVRASWRPIVTPVPSAFDVERLEQCSERLGLARGAPSRTTRSSSQGPTRRTSRRRARGRGLAAAACQRSRRTRAQQSPGRRPRRPRRRARRSRRGRPAPRRAPRPTRAAARARAGRAAARPSARRRRRAP